MSDGVEQESAARQEERRLRVGLQWLVWLAVTAVLALTAGAILSAANGSAAGMVAASSGSIAVVLAATTGYLAVTRQLRQLDAPARVEEQG